MTNISENNPVYRYRDSMPHHHIVEEDRTKDSARQSTLDRAVGLYRHIPRKELESAIKEWYLRHGGEVSAIKLSNCISNLRLMLKNNVNK